MFQTRQPLTRSSPCLILYVKASQEAALHMKKLTIVVMGAVVMLWIGYGLGYHHGVREERGAWEATRQVSMLSTTNNGRLTAATRICYADPHHPLYVLVGPTGRGATPNLNGPDPRTYREYERWSP